MKIVERFIPIILLFLFAVNALRAQWVQTNGPDGGCISLAVASNGWLFAGTAGGGVYVSTDDGDNWTQTVLTNSRVYSLLITSSGYIYAGVDQGIYVSMDNGNSWIRRTFAATGDAVISLAVNSAGNIFAGTYSSLYVSTDNGNSWVQRNSGLAGGPVNSLLINSSGYIFAGTQVNGVYLSTDNGSTWTQKGLTSTMVNSMVLNLSGYIIAGTNGKGVYLSTDNGGTWTQRNTGLTNASIYSLAINSSGNVFAGSVGNGVYVSTDNGESWTQKNSGLPNGSQVSSLAINSSDYIFANNGLAVYLSTDNGNNWVQKNSGLKSGNIYSLAVNSSGYVFAGKWGEGVCVSTDNGVTWHHSGPENGWIQSIAVSLSGFVYAGTNGGGVYVSTDNGLTWAQKDSNLSNSNVLSLAISLSGHVFAGTNGGGVFVSTDNGSSWNQKKFTNSPIMSLVVTRSGYLLAGTGSEGIYLSTNNGGTWIQKNSGLPMTSGDNIQSLAINSSGYIFASVWGQGVYVSTNAGDNWILSLTDNSVTTNSIACNLSGHVFVGDRQGKGVYVSTDNGANWTLKSSGLTSGYIYSLAVDPLGYVYAGTFGGGVYRSTGSTDIPPATPNLVSPMNGSTEASLNLILQWNTSSTAVTYGLQVASDLNFTNLVVNQPDIADTSDTLSGLRNSQEYFWRVNAANGGGVSAWSTTWNFTTRSVTLSLISPTGGEEWYAGTTHEIQWSSSNVALIKIEFSSDSGETWSTVTGSVQASQDTLGWLVPDINSNNCFVKIISLLDTTVNSQSATAFKIIKQVGSPGWTYTITGNNHIILIPLSANPTINDTAITAGDYIGVFYDSSGTLACGGYAVWDGARNISVTAWGNDPMSPSPDGFGNGEVFKWRIWQQNIGKTFSARATYMVNSQFPNDSTFVGNGISALASLNGFQSATGVQESKVNPVGYALYQNYPNPFNPSTTITYDVPKRSHVLISIYDVLGREVRTLVNREEPTGSYRVTFDASSLPSGVYFYRIEAGTYHDTKKLLLLK